MAWEPQSEIGKAMKQAGKDFASGAINIPAMIARGVNTFIPGTEANIDWATGMRELGRPPGIGAIPKGADMIRTATGASENAPITGTGPKIAFTNASIPQPVVLKEKPAISTPVVSDTVSVPDLMNQEMQKYLMARKAKTGVEEVAPPAAAVSGGFGVGKESDADFWRRKDMEWKRLDATRAVDKAMAGRGDIMSLWQEAIKKAGIGSSTGGIKLARQSQNAIALLNHILDAQGKAEANAIAGAEGIYGRDIAGFGAESADRYHTTMADIAGQKAPAEIAHAQAQADLARATAAGVPTKAEAKKLAEEQDAATAISNLTEKLMTNQGLDAETASFEANRIWQASKGSAQGKQGKRSPSMVLKEIQGDKTAKADILKRAKSDPRIAAFVEQNKEIFK